jgi:cell division protein FtsI/penicillin-binding protein 2
MDVMRSTVHGGTASQIFGKGRYRTIADEVGGKTGTLNGRTPAGLTSLFIGVYPVSSPRIAVASVVVLEDRYLFKAPQLAAEAILSWKEMNDKNTHARR